jgi:hypothetical protein
VCRGSSEGGKEYGEYGEIAETGEMQGCQCVHASLSSGGPDTQSLHPVLQSLPLRVRVSPALSDASSVGLSVHLRCLGVESAGSISDLVRTFDQRTRIGGPSQSKA